MREREREGKRGDLFEIFPLLIYNESCQRAMRAREDRREE
jgi:hypothetical protein